MSVYSFIADNYEIPEVNNSKERIITAKEAIELGIKAHEFMPWNQMRPNNEILFFEEESDLGEFVITKFSAVEDDVRWYTDKSFIYSVDFIYSELRIIKLLEYLKENIKEGHQLELWSIWLDDKKNVQPIIYNYEEVSLKNIKQIYDSQDKK